jgi:hypothetical protein
MKHKTFFFVTTCLVCILGFSLISLKTNPVPQAFAKTVLTASIVDSADESDVGDTTAGTAAAADKGIDVLQIMKDMNGDDQPKPSSDFRDG